MQKRAELKYMRLDAGREHAKTVGQRIGRLRVACSEAFG
ncbi:Uncharacterised protein [Mycobacterium tuberculosis]|nr:Uncharacterised protein [Mycobacterium tuberculosis]